MSRYDHRTTTFSPEGRLYQVEYAVEAIQQAGTMIGITTTEGVVLVGKKGIQNALLDSENMQKKDISGDKMFKISDHLGCCAAGVTSDALSLLNVARLTAQRHYYTFHQPIAIEDLCRSLCDEMQMYTQYGGVRPFGVSFLLAGWDRFHGFQLYSTEPSGDYSAWSAYAVGQNDQVARSILKKEWTEGLSLRDGLLLGLRIIGKTLDSVKLDGERIEVAVLRKRPAGRTFSLLDPYAPQVATVPAFHIMTDDELAPLLEEAEKLRQEEEAKEKDKERQQEQRLEKQ